MPDKSRVLDVGCGSGLFLAFLLSHDKLQAGTGFDVAEDAIAAANVARTRLEGADRLQFSVRAVEAGIPRGDWTVVSAIDVIHHIPPTRQADFIAELCSATPPGALLIIKDMVARPRWRAFANRLHDLLSARQWVHHTQAATVKALISDPDMVCVHQGGRNMLWYGHWTLVYRRKI